MFKEKYIIGVSGHRDLKVSEINNYKQQIKTILKEKKRYYNNKEVYILTPLAEGADQLIALAAKELGIRYEALLPMPLQLYKKDFSSKSYAKFYKLFLDAAGSSTVPLSSGTTLDEIQEYSKKRDNQYLQVGKTVVDRSDFMLFLWDGVVNNKKGGTADIFAYAKAKKQDNFNKSHFLIECERESK